MRVARSVSVTALGVVACLAFGSCAKNPEVELVLVDGCVGAAPPDPNTDCQRPPCPDGVQSFRETAAYAEIAVFAGKCPTDDDLITGDTSRAKFHAVVPATDRLPSVGDLSKDTYGFAALLRDANCGVIAMGCTTADLSSIRRVNVSVRAWRTDAHPHDNVCAPYTPDQGCVDPLMCVEGSCVGEGGVPEGGTGDCDLTVVASGTLPAAITPDAQVTGPAVAATSDGFVLAYRQLDPTTGKLQVVALKLPDSGTLGAPATVDLESCASQAPIGGLGLAFTGTTGLMAAGLPDCPGPDGGSVGAGAAFVPVDEAGKLSAPKTLRNPAFSDLKLAQGHSLSARPNIIPDGGSSTPAFDFAYRAIQSGSTLVQVGQVLGYGQFFGSPTAIFSDPADYGMVATTDKLSAVLGRVPSRGADILQVTGNSVTPPPPPPVDAGSEAGAEGGTEAGTDSGASGNGEFVLPDSPSWGALSAFDDRVAAIVPGGGAGLTLQVVDATGKDIGKSNITGGVFQSGDIAFLRDHLIVAAGSSDSVTFYRVDGAAAASSVSAAGATKVEYKDALGKASLTDFDGTRIAVTGARDHVVVVWLSSLALTKDVPTGGWAMLSCKK